MRLFSISAAPRGCTACRRPRRWRALPRNVENNLRITVSIGLSCNKFLAKVASEIDKPRGFAVLGAGDARHFSLPSR